MINEDLKVFLLANNIKFEEHVSLKQRTWIHRGGIAQLYISPYSVEELEKLCAKLYAIGSKFELIGHTSNLYFQNNYNPNIVVTTRHCKKVDVTEEALICECGVPVSSLAKNCIDNGVGGLEYFTILPGTLAAAVCNNSTSGNHTFTHLITSVEVLTPNGKLTLSRDQLGLSYRNSIFKAQKIKGVILKVVLRRTLGNIDEMREAASKNEAERKILLEGPQQNLGCTFNREFSLSKKGLLQKLFDYSFAVYSKVFRLSKATTQRQYKNLLLTITGYAHLKPYISNKLFLTYLWKDDKADDFYKDYVDFMHKIRKTDSQEIEIRKAPTVNLVTIHWGNCYGAVMQTYASCKILTDLGCKVNVVNLVHPNTKINYRSLRKLSYAAVDFGFYKFKKKYFCNLTKLGYSIDSMQLPVADATIIGSDQVWNRSIANGFEKTYFLDFVPENQKRISLSSSFGKDRWQEDEAYTSEVKKLLNKFFAISVREGSGAKILSDVFGVRATHLVDPTLGLLDFSEIVPFRKPKKEIYTFLFSANSAVTHDIVKSVATTLNLPVYQHTQISSRFDASPKAWLQHIADAEFFITDSFHGLALSLILKKNFIVLCADKTKFTRLANLLELVGLQDRYVSSMEDLGGKEHLLTEPVDYSKVMPILQKEKEKMKVFLTEALL